MGKFDAIYFGEDENNIDGKRGRRNPAAAQSELILSKEQLYDMFQYILGLKRFEHQLLYQGCQVIFRIFVPNFLQKKCHFSKNTFKKYVSSNFEDSIKLRQEMGSEML